MLLQSPPALSPCQEVWADAIALVCPENPSVPRLADALGVPVDTLQPPTEPVIDLVSRRATHRRPILRRMLIWIDAQLWSLIGRLS